MSEIINPHDKLFRETWSDLPTAKSFLHHYLPPKVLAITDLDTLEICKDTFVEKDLTEFYVDLLYRVTLAGSVGHIYILFEHKSYRDPFTPLQLLGYMVRIWRLFRKQHHGKKLPVIIPLVLYHGRTPADGANRRFSSLIESPADVLSSYIPDFNHEIYDLTQFSDDQIKGEVMGRVTMLLFKHIYDPRMRDKLGGIISLLHQLSEAQSVAEYLETVFRYIISNIDDVSVDELTRTVGASLSEKQGELIMTLAEKLRKEGFEKGIHQGKIEGIHQGKIEGLKQGLIEGVELAISLKFPEESIKIIPLVCQIPDIASLKAVKSVIVLSRTADELIAHIKGLF